jgi:hypothetical protein
MGLQLSTHIGGFHTPYLKSFGLHCCRETGRAREVPRLRRKFHSCRGRPPPRTLQLQRQNPRRADLDVFRQMLPLVGASAVHGPRLTPVVQSKPSGNCACRKLVIEIVALRSKRTFTFSVNSHRARPRSARCATRELSRRRVGSFLRHPERRRNACSGLPPAPKTGPTRITMYVEALIGRDTVVTVPPATMDAFRDHGEVAADVIEQGLAGRSRDARRARAAQYLAE